MSRLGTLPCMETLRDKVLEGFCYSGVTDTADKIMRMNASFFQNPVV